jgi:hypothetical protein
MLVDRSIFAIFSLLAKSSAFFFSSLASLPSSFSSSSLSTIGWFQGGEVVILCCCFLPSTTHPRLHYQVRHLIITIDLFPPPPYEEGNGFLFVLQDSLDLETDMGYTSRAKLQGHGFTSTQHHLVFNQ